MSEDPGTKEHSTESPYDQDALLQYLALQDQIRWQGPALALAAQAFLLTVALAHDAAPAARLIGSVLGAVTSGAAIYLITRKGRQIDQLKKMLKNEKFPIDGLAGAGMSASRVWQSALWTFIVADLLVVTITLLDAPLLGGRVESTKPRQCVTPLVTQWDVPLLVRCLGSVRAMWLNKKSMGEFSGVHSSERETAVH